MSNCTAAPERILEVALDERDDDTIRVTTHGPHRRGYKLCLAATCCDQGDVIGVTVSEDGAFARRLARTDSAVLDQALVALLVVDGCTACATRKAIMQAVTALVPLRPTSREIAIHAAIDHITDSMPGHECDKETS